MSVSRKEVSDACIIFLATIIVVGGIMGAGIYQVLQETGRVTALVLKPHQTRFDDAFGTSYVKIRAKSASADIQSP